MNYNTPIATRGSRPNWYAYFFNLAQCASIRSTVPTVQVGAVVVGTNNHMLATGYNDLPQGVKHLTERYERPLKYTHVIHAEINAIAHAARHGVALDGATIYITSPPCQRCLNMIIQAGIRNVFFLKDRRPEEQLNAADHEAEQYLLEIFSEVSELETVAAFDFDQAILQDLFVHRVASKNLPRLLSVHDRDVFPLYPDIVTDRTQRYGTPNSR